MTKLIEASHRLAERGLRPKSDLALARRGYWRVGGEADLFVEVGTPSDLAFILTLGLPVTVIGRGSNLLVADAGIRGIVIRLSGQFRESHVVRTADGVDVIAGSGLDNAVLLKRLDDAELSGLGCLAGVPGTVGGAVRMNAGTHLGALGDRVRQVEVALPNGSVRLLPAEALQFRYRWASLPPGGVVTRVWLQVFEDPATVARHRAEVQRHLARRKATQPLSQPSCGSTFKNPPGDAAGRLIDSAGLKGHAIGGAQISETHANFFVNTGNASAMDLYQLICLARQTVYDRHGIQLEPEVHAVGDWPPGLWPLPPL